MTLLALDEGEQAQISFTDLRLQSRRRIRPLAPAPLTHQEIQQETTFDADLVAQLAILRFHAQKLTRNREQALDLVQDTCERALRFRHLFREGTSMRAWVLTIMRHHFLDQAKRSRDAMVRSRSVPMEELSELVHSDARAEQIRFVKEALGLARDGLSEEQGSVFWPILTGATLEACAALHGVPKGTVSTRLHRARSFMRRACVA
jgi:RNA polymerase sigma-70 factor (ECF subfamily)